MRNTRRIPALLPVLTLVVLICGCGTSEPDGRYEQLVEKTLEQQAAQNQAMAKQSQEVADATRGWGLRIKTPPSIRIQVPTHRGAWVGESSGWSTDSPSPRVFRPIPVVNTHSIRTLPGSPGKRQSHRAIASRCYPTTFQSRDDRI